jgi:hypothetical protein
MSDAVCGLIAATSRQFESAQAASAPLQHDRKITKLINEYEAGALVKELARQFGIHRLAVAALLQRHEVELRRSGLSPEDIPTAGQLYGQGWSLARLGEKYGAESTTAWRGVRAAVVSMRSLAERPALRIVLA